MSGLAGAWTPGTYTSPMPSKGFTVDASSRNDVISFWKGVYEASEGYQHRIGWTGTYAGSNYDVGAGTVSEVFIRDVERRLNFYRALTGSVPTASLNSGATVMIVDADTYKPADTTLKSYANQRSAYMIARAYMANDETDGADHNPPTNVIGWSNAAWNANAHSNLTYGYFGPGAIDAYMNEADAGTSGSDNSMIRHRRWLLYQAATDYSTGDTPGLYVDGEARVRQPTNSLYVWQKPTELAVVTPQFVTYPTAGYFPAPLNSKYWSVSHPNANFSGATVVMKTAAGATASTTKITAASTGGPGDSSLVWQVNSSVHYSTEAPTDRLYNISITGITGAGVPSTLDYTVILIDPDNFTSDQSLTGTSAPPAAGSANYFMTLPGDSEKVAVDVFAKSSTDWTETAETGAATTVVNKLYTFTGYTPYTFLSGAVGSMSVINGSKMFRMAHPVRWDIMAEGVPQEIFELTREILPVPATTPTLTFKYKRGHMTVNSRLVVEWTQDNGATWTALGSPITGKTTATTINDTTIQNWTGTFPASTEPYRVRFRFYRENTNGTTVLIQSEQTAATPTGIFIDDISTDNCDWLDLKKSNELAAGDDHFTFNAASASTAGTALVNNSEHRLRMKTKLGNQWLKYGPTKVLTVTNTPQTGFNGWFAYEYPTLLGGFAGDHDGDGIPNAIECAFYLNPLSPGTSSDSINVDLGLAKALPLVSISRPIPAMRSGLTYGAEWSDDLATGSWSSDGVVVTHAGGLVTALAPAGTGKRFLRWKITGP